jgi:hypothetical protein
MVVSPLTALKQFRAKHPISHFEIENIPCRFCHADVAESCRSHNGTATFYHMERMVDSGIFAIISDELKPEWQERDDAKLEELKVTPIRVDFAQVLHPNVVDRLAEEAHTRGYNEGLWFHDYVSLSTVDRETWRSIIWGILQGAKQHGE